MDGKILQCINEFIISVQQGEQDFSYRAVIAQTYPDHKDIRSLGTFDIYGDTANRGRREFRCRWLDLEFFLQTEIVVDVIAGGVFVERTDQDMYINLVSPEDAIDRFKISPNQIEVVEILEMTLG